MSNPYEIHISANLNVDIEEFEERLSGWMDEDDSVGGYALSSEKVVD